MSRYTRLPIAGSAAPVTNVGDVHDEGLCCNGTGHIKATRDVVPQHRRAISGSDINPKRLQMVEKKSHSEDSLPEPPVGMDEMQRLTWQAQWGEALKKVQTLRRSGAQSERWSGVATDIYRPKSQETQATGRVSNASPLDRWNYYPGPSANRGSSPQSQPNRTIPNAWSKDFLSGAMSNREAKSGSTTGSYMKGRGSKSISSYGKLESHPVESKTGDDFSVAQQQTRSTALDQTSECPEGYSALPTPIKRTQSQRYGRKCGQKLEANSGPAVPKPILKKAISMREGGAHQDAVLEMARAYTDTVCGVAKSLECGACGRNLGIIVQGNPGVDIAFCQACRPSPSQWKKPVSDSVAGSRRTKNVIVQFCRKMLRLDNIKKSK